MEEKKYWCQKCFRISQIPKPEKPITVKPVQVVKRKLCPECGASVTSLKTHMSRHHSEPQTCPHCGKVLNGLVAMKDHISTVHEKVPCAQCGKLVGPKKMNFTNVGLYFFCSWWCHQVVELCFLLAGCSSSLILSGDHACALGLHKACSQILGFAIAVGLSLNLLQKGLFYWKILRYFDQIFTLEYNWLNRI